MEDIGGERVAIDFGPFLEAARLLYEGPWVAERYVAIREFFEAHANAMHPVTRRIIGGGKEHTATALFPAQHRLQALKRETDAILSGCDCVLTPTAGRCYTQAEVEAEPIKLNTNLGHYTNFMNLLDYAAVALPMGFDAAGVPAGATLFGPAFSDHRLLQYAARYLAEEAPTISPKACNETDMKLVVCGAHMSGLPLNGQLTSRGGRLLRGYQNRAVLSIVRASRRTATATWVGARYATRRCDRRGGMAAGAFTAWGFHGRHTGTARDRAHRTCRWQHAAGLFV